MSLWQASTGENPQMAAIDLTPQQAEAIAHLTQRLGAVALHQLAPGQRQPNAGDVYATPHGSDSGYRIAVDGTVTPIGHTLPASD